jgi:formyltetrahydrofolate synthetase
MRWRSRLVALCGEIAQVPGLGKTPAAVDVELDSDGRIVGLF